MEQQLILDRYRPLAELGEGGYGTVVLAYDTRMQRRVAIKRLPFPSDRSGRPVEPAGLAEARTAALLNHPGIVTVHEWDTDDDEAFIIMEHVDGATVADLLEAADGPLTLDEAAAVLDAVSEAVSFAHDNGVLHLDIKAENVLVTRDGRVKVTDFGVAALSSAAGYGHGAGGTLGSMPIEQLRGEPLDERTDSWAYAVLAFQLLADANPMYADTFEGAAFKADKVEPPAPSDFVADLPPAIDDILLAALAPDPDDRYPDVRTLADHLAPHLGDPARGRRSLAELAQDLCDDDSTVCAEENSLGVWDRLMPRRAVVTGAASALIAGWLAWAGLAPFGLPVAPVAAAAGISAVAAAFAPGLGLGVGAVIVAAGLAKAGMPLIALLVFAVTAVLWWTVGRRGAGLLPAFPGPVLGVAWASLAAPLICGFTLRPIKAAVLGAVGAVLTLMASALSGAGAPYTDVAWRFFLDPWGTAPAEPLGELLVSAAPLVVVASWSLAAALMSLASSRATRTGAFLGAALGLSALGAGYSAAGVIATSVNSSVTWSGEPLLLRFAASSILVVLVIAAGPPVRAEE